MTISPCMNLIDEWMDRWIGRWMDGWMDAYLERFDLLNISFSLVSKESNMSSLWSLHNSENRFSTSFSLSSSPCSLLTSSIIFCLSLTAWLNTSSNSLYSFSIFPLASTIWSPLPKIDLNIHLTLLRSCNNLSELTAIHIYFPLIFDISFLLAKYWSCNRIGKKYL